MAIYNCYEPGDIHDVVANAWVTYLLPYNKLLHNLVHKDNSVYYLKDFADQ